jgi:hypothetical protein
MSPEVSATAPVADIIPGSGALINTGEIKGYAISSADYDKMFGITAAVDLSPDAVAARAAESPLAPPEFITVDDEYTEDG